MAYNHKEDVFEFIKRNPGLPALRLRAAFRSNVTRSLITLERAGLIKSKRESRGIGRSWEVKCYYPIEERIKDGRDKRNI